MRVAVATATTPPRQATPTPRGRRRPALAIPCPPMPAPPIIGTRQPASRAPAASLRKLRERSAPLDPGPPGARSRRLSGHGYTPACPAPPQQPAPKPPKPPKPRRTICKSLTSRFIWVRNFSDREQRTRRSVTRRDDQGQNVAQVGF